MSNHYDAWGNVIDLADSANPFAKPAMVPSGGPNQALRDQAVKKGGARPDGSFPLLGPDGKPSRTLCSKATRMVQLAKGDQTAIRKWLMTKLRGYGFADLIPGTWNVDGTVGGMSGGS
jgi:hypothetical protein